MARFMIRHPKTGEEYALNSVAAFRKRRNGGDSYEAQGFVIPDDQPHGWTAPKVKADSPGKGAEKPAAATNDGGDTK